MHNLQALRRGERGAVMVETAIVLPVVLLIAVGIFEFGRAYQTWQILTNASREGARVAVLPGSSASNAQERVAAYLEAGQLPRAEDATVDVAPVTLDLGGGVTASGSRVTVRYPFDFVVLQPVARLVVRGSTAGEALTMTAATAMRNE